MYHEEIEKVNKGNNVLVFTESSWDLLENVPLWQISLFPYKDWSSIP